MLFLAIGVWADAGLSLVFISVQEIEEAFYSTSWQTHMHATAPSTLLCTIFADGVVSSSGRTTTRVLCTQPRTGDRSASKRTSGSARGLSISTMLPKFSITYEFKFTQRFEANSIDLFWAEDPGERLAGRGNPMRQHIPWMGKWQDH